MWENHGKRSLALMVALAFLLLQLTAVSPSTSALPILSGPPEKPVAAGWVPPHLEPTKTVSPISIGVRGSGILPETATVTLTVSEKGDPAPWHEPVDVTLEIDCTGSMALTMGNNSKINWTKEAAEAFINTLDFSKDRVAIVEFHGEGTYGEMPVINLVQGFTNNTADLHSAVGSLAPMGGTAFYDATVYATNYTNLNHYPPGHSHPHNPPPPNHHRPVVITLTDGLSGCDLKETLQSCIDFVTNSHNIPPPSTYWGYETTVYTIGLGDYGAIDPPSLQAIADASEGQYYWEPTGSDLQNVYLNISQQLRDTTAATQPSPTESMITDVLPPYIEYQSTWQPTPNNNATIRNFYFVQGMGNMWELRWDVPTMKNGEVFEIQYDIKSLMEGWQSTGVTNYNATNVYGSDYCRVKYQNYQYWKTVDPSDIWTNETNDVSIHAVGTTQVTIPSDQPPSPVAPASPPPPGTPYAPPLDIPLSLPLNVPVIMPETGLPGDVYLPFELALPTINQSNTGNGTAANTTGQPSTAAVPSYVGDILKTILRITIIVLAGWIGVIAWRTRQARLRMRMKQPPSHHLSPPPPPPPIPPPPPPPPGTGNAGFGRF